MIDWRPKLGQTITMTIGTVEGERTYEGTVLDFDESGEFALIWWEDGTRDYRYLHQGYDAQLDERMDWSS